MILKMYRDWKKHIAWNYSVHGMPNALENVEFYFAMWSIEETVQSILDCLVGESG